MKPREFPWHDSQAAGQGGGRTGQGHSVGLHVSLLEHPTVAFERQGQLWVMRIISGTLITSSTLACVFHFVFKLF